LLPTWVVVDCINHFEGSLIGLGGVVVV
jgi:hypothetical protein